MFLQIELKAIKDGCRYTELNEGFECYVSKGISSIIPLQMKFVYNRKYTTITAAFDNLPYTIVMNELKWGEIREWGQMVNSKKEGYWAKKSFGEAVRYSLYKNGEICYEIAQFPRGIIKFHIMGNQESITLQE
jgi:hypothetical protein